MKARSSLRLSAIVLAIFFFVLVAFLGGFLNFESAESYAAEILEGSPDAWADAVISAEILGEGNKYKDPSEALGPPDSRYVSLGGGQIELDMGLGEEILDGEGPDLAVFNVGSGPAESYDLYIAEFDPGNWSLIGSFSGNGVGVFDLATAGITAARFVRIVDNSTSLTGDTPGVDIDYIAAVYSNNDPYADTVLYSKALGASNLATDPKEALGYPDYDESSDSGYISLGKAGELILDMGAGEEVVDGDGDDLRVFNPGADGGEIARAYVRNSHTDLWTYVGLVKGSPRANDFDLGSFGIHQARYVRLLDVSTGDLTGSNPATDVDYVQTLNAAAPVVNSLFAKIVSPQQNVAIGPSTISFSANAWSYFTEEIKRVEFYVFYDSEWQAAGIDENEPYEVIWQTPNKLRSQELKFAIHVVDESDYRFEFADVVYGVDYLESLGNPDVAENWIPTRAYLNQRSLEPNGDIKCSVASMAMVLAMNSLIDWDYSTLSEKADEMYPLVLNADGIATVGAMVSELKRQGLEAETKRYSVDSAWMDLKEEIDAGRPVIVRTAHGAVTPAGHFFVSVGYREAAGSRQVIAYDPFGRWLGTCCANNYDLNTRDPGSTKGRWVSYDFDLAFGAFNWLITASAGEDHSVVRSLTIPSTRPDIASDEPEEIGTYEGVEIQVPAYLYIPVATRP